LLIAISLGAAPYKFRGLQVDARARTRGPVSRGSVEKIEANKKPALRRALKWPDKHARRVQRDENTLFVSRPQ
jgi:hypothetical protein